MFRISFHELWIQIVIFHILTFRRDRRDWAKIPRRNYSFSRECSDAAPRFGHHTRDSSLGSAIDDNRAVAAVLRGVAKLVRVSKVYRWKSEEQPIRGQPPWGRDVAMVAFEPSQAVCAGSLTACSGYAACGVAFRSRVPRPNPPRHVLPVPRFSSLSPHPRNCPPFLVQRPTRIIVVAAVYIYIYPERERIATFLPLLAIFLFPSAPPLLLYFSTFFTPFALSLPLFHPREEVREQKKDLYLSFPIHLPYISLTLSVCAFSVPLSLSFPPPLPLYPPLSLQALCLCLSHRHSRFPALSKINTSQRGLKTCVNMVLHCLYVHITLSARLLPPTRKPAGHFTTPYRRGQVREAERIARGSNTAARRGQTMFDKAAYILARITVRHPTARATMLY